MSSSLEFSSLTTKSAEKPSTFSQACRLLSQYIKEKGGFGDLNLGMTCNADANGSSEMCRQRSTTTLNLFPQKTAPSQFVSEESTPKKPYANSSVANKPVAEDSKNPQMTIFYAGQVYVFDDFPADKAKDVMSMATRNSSQNNLDSVARRLVHSPVNPSSPVSTNVNSTPPATNNLIPECRRQQPTVPVVRDLPIARKASLHRFLEKRKDRIASKVPYQTRSPISAKPAAESKPWLVLAAQAPQ